MHEDGPLARHIEQHVEGTIGELKKVDGQIRLRLSRVPLNLDGDPVIIRPRSWSHRDIRL
jgi:hypothetical protein